jgi:hypothetical protein
MRELIIYWSRADQTFLAEVPEFPSCMADGASYAEALANAQLVIADDPDPIIHFNGERFLGPYPHVMSN